MKRGATEVISGVLYSRCDCSSVRFVYMHVYKEDTLALSLKRGEGDILTLSIYCDECIIYRSSISEREWSHINIRKCDVDG